MKWTYDDYLDQPLWFIRELTEQMTREVRQAEQQARRMRHG